MENTNNKTPDTLESVSALIKELALNFDSEMVNSRAEFKQQMAESRAEFDQRMAESDVKFNQRMAESSAKFDREMAESRAEFDRRMGSYSNNIGAFAEEYFFNSLKIGKCNFFGEEFDDVEKNLKGIKKNYKDEYDIVLFNGKSVAIVEVKFKAHENDLPNIIKKAETFRINYPDYANHRVYIGLATMAFYPELETECEKVGIAIVKQAGDSMVINDEHLKEF